MIRWFIYFVYTFYIINHTIRPFTLKCRINNRRNSIVINYEIQKNYIGTLAISGKLKERLELAIAIRGDDKIL